MIELLCGARIDDGAEGCVIHKREAKLGGAHPQVSLVEPRGVLFRVRPMMHVGRPDEPGRWRGSRGKVSSLTVPGSHVAGQAVIPTAGFGGREAQHDAPPAVPI